MIAFLLSPIGKIVGAAGMVALLIAGFFGWLHFHDKALLAGYVLQSEKVAVQAQLDEVTRQLNAGRVQLAGYQERLRAIKEQEDAQDAALEVRDRQDAETIKAANRSCPLSVDDIDRVLKSQR